MVLGSADGSCKQRLAWAAVAAAAPLAHFCGCGWLTAGAAGLVGLTVSFLAASGWQRLGKFAAAVELGWLAVVLGSILPASGADWPGQGAGLVVPLMLLALAAWSDSQAGIRLGAVIFGILSVLAVPVAVSAVSQLRWGYMLPTWKPVPAGLAVAVLLPALAGVFGTAPKTGWFQLGLLPIALGAIAQGILSQPVAAESTAVFWEVSRTLGRWEPLMAVALTLGWYGFASFLLAAAGRFGQVLGLGETKGRWTAAAVAAGWMAANIQVPGLILLGGTLAAWILIPGILGKRKK